MTSGRAAMLMDYVPVALEVGLDPYHILADIGVSPSQLRNPEERLPRGAIASILERSAMEANCPHFGGDTALVRAQIVSKIDFAPRQAHEAVGAMLSRVFIEIGGSAWKPECLYFMHAAPDALEVHHRVLGCPVHFGSGVNGVAYARAALHARLPRGNERGRRLRAGAF